MLPLFYHDQSNVRLLSRLGMLSTAAVLISAMGCSRGAQKTDAPPATAPSASATQIPAAPSTADSAQTPTAAAIEAGRAAIEKVRAASGGPAVTKFRSFEIAGTSTMTNMRSVRELKVIALYPQFFRQDEASPTGTKTPGPHITIGLQGPTGWMNGARLGGDGQSADRAVAQAATTRAAQQAMAGFIAGINVPWLLDTGSYTMTEAEVVNAGVDKGALQVIIDGPGGRVGRLLIDPGTHLPRRLIQPPQKGGGGNAATADIVFTYSDFQPQDGLQLPHTIVRENGPAKTTWSIKTYAVNPKISPRRFVSGAK